jgi:hypothetical protein
LASNGARDARPLANDAPSALPFLLVREVGPSNIVEEQHATEKAARESARHRWHSFVLYAQSATADLTELDHGGVGFGHAAIRRHASNRRSSVGALSARASLSCREASAEDLSILPLIELAEEEGHVTALHSDGDATVVGTSSGRLLRITRSGQVASRCVLSSATHAQRAAARSVTAVHVLGAPRLVVALCDGLATVHALGHAGGNLGLHQITCLNNAATRAERIGVHAGGRLPCVVLSVAALKALVRRARLAGRRRCSHRAATSSFSRRRSRGRARLLTARAVDVACVRSSSTVSLRRFSSTVR